MLMFVLSGVAIVACSDMNDLHDKYLQQGETIYSAKFDSVKKSSPDDIGYVWTVG